MADPEKEPESLQALRARIDQIDAEIHRLLVERCGLTHHIGNHKRRNGWAVWVPDREERVISSLLALPRGHLSERGLRAVFREVLSAGRETQGGLHVAVTGPEEACAARAFFGDCVDLRECASLLQAIEQVRTGQAQLLVVESSQTRELAPLSVIKTFTHKPAGQTRASKTFNVCGVV